MKMLEKILYPFAVVIGMTDVVLAIFAIYYRAFKRLAQYTVDESVYSMITTNAIEKIKDVDESLYLHPIRFTKEAKRITDVEINRWLYNW